MVTQALLSLVGSVVSTLLGLFPAYEPWSWLSLAAPSFPGGASGVAGLALANRFFPLYECFSLAYTVVTVVLPGLMLLRIGNWIWDHFPTIAGFGPKS